MSRPEIYAKPMDSALNQCVGGAGKIGILSAPARDEVVATAQGPGAASGFDGTRCKYALSSDELVLRDGDVLTPASRPAGTRDPSHQSRAVGRSTDSGRGAPQLGGAPRVALFTRLGRPRE
jgi:hypothetical protein